MKKIIIGVVVGCALSGCEMQYWSRSDAGTSPGTNFPHQQRAPLPWIAILPSKDALAMVDADFDIIERNIRYDLVFHFNGGFARARNVSMILVDYKVRQPKSSSLKGEHVPQKGETLELDGITYAKKVDIAIPEYVLNLKFYKGDNKPPHKPDFEETITMNQTDAAPTEAIRFLAHEALMDFVVTKLDKVDVKLNQ